MKKSYFMLVCLVLLSAFTAKAQVASVADLFGKYRFTADVELTEEGQSYKDVLSGDCDATIEEDGTYIAKIVGFAGSQVQQNINAISTEQNMVKVLNLNNPALWNNGLMLANENGDNPYGVWNSETSNWDVESYGPVYYTYDPATKEISIPAFTVITMSDYSAAKGTIIAKYTNVKMTLVEAEAIEVADISGDWNFAAGSGTYDTMAGSVIPADFSIALAKSGDDNRAYTATIAIEGYDNVEMPATFDGNTLALSYDDIYLDETNGIRFAPMYGSSKKGTIEFKSQSETSFTLYSGFSFASDKMGKAKDEVTDSLYVNGEYHQWYIAGTLKKPSEAPAFSWDGTWSVKVGDAATDVILATAGKAEDWPADFQMEVVYYEVIDAYYVTKFLGRDIANVNQGGLKLVPTESGATIALDGYYGCAFLGTNEDGTFIQLTNSSGLTEPLKLTLNDDGTVSVEDLFVQNLDFNTGETTPVVFYQNLTATKEVAEPEVPVFSWVGAHTVNATSVTAYDGQEYPKSFDMTVIYDEYSGKHLVTSFIGNDVAGINYGGIQLAVAEDGKSAELSCGSLVGGAYPEYLVLRDMNGGNEAINFVLNEDGTVSVDNFFVQHMNYNTDETSPAVLYEGVTIGEAVEPETPAFDWAGTYVFDGEAVSKDGGEYPGKFEVVVEFVPATEYTPDMYVVTEFMGNDVYDINYGGIALAIAEDGRSATLANGNVKSLGGGNFLKLFNAEATAAPIAITLNEDGSLSMADFTVVSGAWGNDTDNTLVAEYKNAILTKGESVEPEEPAKQYRVKCDNGYLNVYSTLAYPTGPIGGVNVVEYSEDDNQIFTIEEADGAVYLKSVSGYYIYCQSWNVDGNADNKSALTFEETADGKFYIKCANGYFKVEYVSNTPVATVDGAQVEQPAVSGYFPYCDAAIGAAALWILEEVGAETAIDEVVVENNTVKGVFDIQGRKVEQISAPGLYIIDGRKVLVK